MAVADKAASEDTHWVDSRMKDKDFLQGAAAAVSVPVLWLGTFLNSEK